MQRKDRLRLGLILLVVVLAAVAVFPIQDRVKLGLDLRGGAHIVLRAKASGDAEEVDADTIDKLVAVLRNRIDQYGIVEPQIQREGRDRVAIDLPGVADPEAALELIGQTAKLEFRQVTGAGAELPPAVDRANYPNDEEYNQALANYSAIAAEVERANAEIEERAKNDPDVFAARGENGDLYLLGTVYVTGGELADARMTYDEFQRPAVSLRFTSEGSTMFEDATAANINRQIAIVLDKQVISAPVVRGRIAGGSAQITGRFTADEAARLAVMLRAGALPVDVEVLENRSVGPTLGEDSIRSGLRSGLIGAGLVAIFMLIYYGLRGIAADIALAVAMLSLVALMVVFNSTLTLPGIGGIILSIGMAVDGNVLIFERIKEERRSGKTAVSALDSGFRKALVVILDSNITTLIASAVLFYFGSGPVRGFAVTLSLGVITAMFGNLVVTHTLLRITAKRGAR